MKISDFNSPYTDTRIPIFQRESKLKITWDLLIMAVVLWASFSVPYRILASDNHIDLSYWFITIIFCLDILISFNTTTQKQFLILTDRKSISKHYMKTWFIPDLLAAFPFSPVILLIAGQAIAGGLLFRMLAVLSLLRLIKLFKAYRMFHNLQELLNINPVFMRLIIFIFWFTLGAHYISLSWLFIAAEDQTNTFGIKYIRALYWCINTIATIGYGDITPDHNSAHQMIYTVTIQLIGIGMYSYIIANIVTLISKLNILKTNFKGKFFITIK